MGNPVKKKLKIGIIGCGHWGPNHVRNFSSFPDSEVAWVSDLNEERLKFIRDSYPGIRVSKDYRDIIADPLVDAVVISTPTSTHYQIVKDSLAAGKNVLCEKPLTLRSWESEELVRLAEEKRKTLMVGHVFLYNIGVQKLKEYINSGSIGKIYYLHSTRVNLGPIRNDVNAVWDLASHDISIFCYLFDKFPEKVSANGNCFLRDNIEDVAFVSLMFSGGVLANAHVSWLDPRKVREIVVVGDKKMIVWNDMALEDTLRIYEKSVEGEPYYSDFGDFQLLPKEGNVIVPKLKLMEPLKNQSRHFIDCLKEGKRPISDGEFGWKVVRVLEAAQKSLSDGGKVVDLR